jgi:ArsR family transcriptional regulator, arsenate/arsenite/antimonite-responsive transcriptional repressor
MTMEAIGRLVQTHKAIAHPVRLRLLAMLRGGPLCVCQMTVVVQLAASTVSEHLAELRRAGLVVERKEGRWVEYRLADSAAAELVLPTLWSALDEDANVRADGVLVKELRRVGVEELCGANLELARLANPRLATAVAKADRIRATAGSGR